MTVYISGQKYFAEMVLHECLRLGVKVAGVCCPPGDKYIGRLAAINEIPITLSGSMTPRSIPGGVDLGISAHSFDYISRAARYRPRLGWIGYHPSLLPRHRGRSSIEWAIKMGDFATGGTVFWLNAGIDRGDIAYSEMVFIDPALRVKPLKEAARILWQSELLPMGVRLMRTAVSDISRGVIIKKPQDNRFSTFEPSTDVKDLYRPDLLMIEQFSKNSVKTAKV